MRNFKNQQNHLSPENKLLLFFRSAPLKAIKYKTGKVIFYEDTRPTGIYFIKKGKAKLFKTSSSGREHMMGIFNEGSLIGFEESVSRRCFCSTAIALEDSEIYFLPAEIFSNFMAEAVSAEKSQERTRSGREAITAET